MRWNTFLPAVILLPLAVGCGDMAAQRSVTVRQIITTNHQSNKFDLDLSRIPAGWIEERTVEHHPWGDTTFIELDQEHPVKIIVVPADMSIPSATSPGQ